MLFLLTITDQTLGLEILKIILSKSYFLNKISTSCPFDTSIVLNLLSLIIINGRNWFNHSFTVLLQLGKRIFKLLYKFKY